MRNVLVFSTKSNTTTKVETSASTWGELSSFLESKKLYNSSGMKAIVKETSTTLELKEAALPEGDFVLILIPTKNNSGVEIDKKVLLQIINEHLDSLAEDIEDYINDIRTDLESAVEELSITEQDRMLVEKVAQIKKELGL